MHILLNSYSPPANTNSFNGEDLNLELNLISIHIKSMKMIEKLLSGKTHKLFKNFRYHIKSNWKMELFSKLNWPHDGCRGTSFWTFIYISSDIENSEFYR